MVSIEGHTLDPVSRERLTHPDIGAVILFARNYVDPTQLGALTRQVREVKTPSLLIGVDQEGGPVQRFAQGFTRLPAMRDIGALYDQQPGRALLWARSVGMVLAAELREAGIDFSFAPVLDLASGNQAIGRRAFHSDPKVVGLLASTVAQGMNCCGVRAVAKHFPGHSGVVEDPHNELPSDPRSLRQIRDADLRVYQHLDPQCFGGVMTCHVRFDQVDVQPVTFSKKWLNEELRHQLGFTGAIFSDDLMMGAVTALADAPERVLRARQAGCDMVLLCNDDQETDRVLSAAGLPPLDELGQARLARMRANSAVEIDATSLTQARKQVHELAWDGG